MQNRMLSEYRLFAGLSEEECQAVLTGFFGSLRKNGPETGKI